MSGNRNLQIKLRNFFAAIVFLISIISIQQMASGPVDAGQLGSRSISISDSVPSATVNHTFGFETVSTGNVQSIRLRYCTNNPFINDPCTVPSGLDLTSALLAGQFGITGFSISPASDANTIILNRTPSIESPTPSIYSFDNVINPDVPDMVVYVRIIVTDGVDASGSIIDDGAVVFVTEDRFDLSAYVPPYLTFCAAVTVAVDCSSATGFVADFGEFSSNTATGVTTQLSASTNDPTGYNAFIEGQTMTSGTNIIPALSSTTTSSPGTSQFGVNLRANSNPSVGSNPDAGPEGAGSPAPNYNSPNQFRFVDGELIASASGATGFNRYTVSYLVNVSEDQSPGLYATTLTYTAIASF